MDYRFSLAGLVVGVLVGLTGVGGSAILAPMLILLLGFKPSTAVGTDLLYSVPTKLLAVVLHARQRTIDWTVAGWLSLGGLPGALAGLALFAVLRAHVDRAALETNLRHGIGFAILLACLGAVATWYVRRPGARRPTSPGVARPLSPPAIAAIGLLVGFLVSLTSIGSGSVTLPLLVFTLPSYALRRLIGAEIAFAAILVPVAAVGHASFGDVDWLAVAALLLGALPGVAIGSRLCAIVDEHWLRPVIVGVLAFAGSRLV